MTARVRRRDAQAGGERAPSARFRRVVVACAVVALVLPALVDRDSFPLSTYPMYSQSRGDVVTLATANGISSSGERTRLSLDLIGDSDDPLIVAALVRDAIRLGPDSSGRLCAEIAGRVAASGRDGSIARVEVVTESHDVVANTIGDASLAAREVHATCEVDR